MRRVARTGARSGGRRLLDTGIVALIAICMVAVLAPSAALAADSGAESDFVSRINAERTSRGLSKLVVASDLVRVARDHSAEMAKNDDLYHNPNLGSDVSNWRSVGENVGRGPSVSLIHNAFMDSSGHRSNILNSDWVEVGVGVVVAPDGQMWVTEIFRLPKTSSPDPEPAPEPKPEPEPAPTSDPAPDRTSQPAPSVTRTTAPSTTSAQAPAPTRTVKPAPKPDPVPVQADVMLQMIDN